MADFTYVTAPYNKIYDTYIDEHEIVTIDEKQPKLGNTGVLVAGDSNSQFMTFEINRYYDNIDLSDKFIKIFYIFTTEDGKIKPTKKNPIYSDDACNICYNDKKLRFSWLLPAEVALNSGKVAANISIIGEDNYSLNTTLFELEIQTSLTGNDITEATAKLSWISDIEARLYKVEQATGGVDLDYNTLVNKPKINGIELDGDTPISFVEQASASDLGGIKSLPKTEDQTQPVGIDEEGFLWVKPSSGGAGGGTGADGFSPIVSMTEEEGGTLLIIIDKNGPQTTHIKNGINGADGSSVTVTKDETIEGEHKIIFTDKDGEKEITIKDGVDGKDGKALIDDDAESGSDVSWSVDKIIAYTQKVLEDIENGTY